MVEIRKINPEDNNMPDPRDAEIDSLRAEVSGLSALVRRVLAERGDTSSPTAQAPEPPPLEPKENERERILQAWAAEPKVAIFIAPDDYDKLAANELAARGFPPEFPPMVFKVNGVELAVPKGKQATVPESVAALYAYMLNPWEAQQKLPPLTFEQVAARMG